MSGHVPVLVSPLLAQRLAGVPTARLRRSRRPTLNEGRSPSPGDTKTVICGTRAPPHAQRRPEPKPRRHRSALPARRSACPSLNEGRSPSPGDTRSDRCRARRTRTCAQRRPEPKPRRHSAVQRAGAWLVTLNEGRSPSPGDTRGIRHWFCVSFAQRRPEPKPRRHARQEVIGLLLTLRSTKAGAQAPATRGESGTKSSGFTTTVAQRRPEPKPRRHRRDGAGWKSLSPCAQRRPEPKPRRHPGSSRG